MDAVNRQLQWVRALTLLTMGGAIWLAIRAYIDLGNDVNQLLLGCVLVLLGVGLVIIASFDEANPRRLAAVWISLGCYMGLVFSWLLPAGVGGIVTDQGNGAMLVFLLLGFLAALGTALTYSATWHQPCR